jgi:hypothetical protein
MYELTEAEELACLQEARRELGLLPGPPPGWVEIEHPASSGSYATVTEEAYREVWRKKGWRKVLRCTS